MTRALANVLSPIFGYVSRAHEVRMSNVKDFSAFGYLQEWNLLQSV